MTMDIPRFDAWCSRAVKGIRYHGDRKRVFRELRAHMEDHYDDAMARGLVHWKAVEETLEAMGDPEELAPLLADIHRPGWGYALDFVRSAVGGILICLLVCLLAGPREPEAAFQPDTDLWFETSICSLGTRTLLLHPEVSVTDGDLTLTVTDAAQWYRQIGGGPDVRREEWDLCLRLELCHPDPFFPTASAAPARFWARDDLGNIYPSSAQSHWSDIHLDLEKHEKVRPGQWEWVYRIECCDPDAGWIELCYDWGGREHVLHIELTGGEGL